MCSRYKFLFDPLQKHNTFFTTIGIIMHWLLIWIHQWKLFSCCNAAAYIFLIKPRSTLLRRFKYWFFFSSFYIHNDLSINHLQILFARHFFYLFLFNVSFAELSKQLVSCHLLQHFIIFCNFLFILHYIFEWKWKSSTH